MIPRLTDIETDLIARRERAEAEGWQGEIEGIDLTLAYLRTKRDEVRLRLGRAAKLGIPALRDAAGGSGTSHRTPTP
ncbi:hypothetical protein ACFVX3_33120 [Rhodococcus erythropolis]